MYNQNRIYRVFQLIAYLRAKPAKTTKQLMQFLNTSERTVYRYIEMLRDLGFVVDKDFSGRLSITAGPHSDFVPFTPQESAFLEKLILGAGRKHLLAESLLKKIRTSGEMHAGADILLSSKLSALIEQIALAIQEGKQLYIENYISAHSQQMSDRVVEPVCFTDNYRSLSAYEIKTGENKYFNVERMGGVRIINRKMKHTDKHLFYKPDIFGFQGKNPDKSIAFEMSLRAATLLKEEFPMSAVHISRDDKKGVFRFAASVQSFKAPARFVKGLNNEVQVTGSPEFVAYLKRFKNS